MTVEDKLAAKEEVGPAAYWSQLDAGLHIFEVIGFTDTWENDGLHWHLLQHPTVSHYSNWVNLSSFDSWRLARAGPLLHLSQSSDSQPSAPPNALANVMAAAPKQETGGAALTAQIAIAAKSESLRLQQLNAVTPRPSPERLSTLGVWSPPGLGHSPPHSHRPIQAFLDDPGKGGLAYASTPAERSICSDDV